MTLLVSPGWWFVGLLDAVGSQPLGGTIRQCPNPGHGGDAHPSLSITERDGGGARLHCFAGCPEREVLRSLGLGVRQLYQPPTMSPRRYAQVARLKLRFSPVVLRRGHPASRGFRLEAVHRYGPADQVADRVQEHLLLRWRQPGTGAKELLWETRFVDGTTVPGLSRTPERALPLYREREVAMAVAADDVVAVVESESSVDAMRGWYATTWAGGAEQVNVERLRAVLGVHSRVVLMPDFDRSGLTSAKRMLAAGLGPAVLLGVPGEDGRDLWRRLGPARFSDAVNQALRVARGGAGSAVTVAADGATTPVAFVAAAKLLGDRRQDPPRPAPTRVPARQPAPTQAPAGPRR